MFLTFIFLPDTSWLIYQIRRLPSVSLLALLAVSCLMPDVDVQTQLKTVDKKWLNSETIKVSGVE